MNRRWLLLAAPAALAAGAGATWLMTDRGAPQGTVKLGGPFSLVDQNGATVTDRDLRGKPTAVFFGFTYCPEICPTTMAHMTKWMQALGPAADKLNVVFVTVDPERDTPEQLKLFLSSFDPRIRGLTGSPDAVAKAAKAYRVYYRKVPLEGGGYTMDHSTPIYLFDAKGRFVEPIGYNFPPERGLAQLKKLLKL
ncbi:SCO family protein [Phenylobacterium sp.]|uniref:SCO family protein n=1 Tax=Phenylobacterium sp. TaxID=1871053 RepID=UPI0035B0E502